MCDGCTVGRVWHIPDNEELDPYSPLASPYEDQGDMQEQGEGLEIEWIAYHDIMQNMDSSDRCSSRRRRHRRTARQWQDCAHWYTQVLQQGWQCGCCQAGRHATEHNEGSSTWTALMQQQARQHTQEQACA